MQLNKDSVLNTTGPVESAYKQMLLGYLDWLREFDKTLTNEYKVMIVVGLDDFWLKNLMWGDDGPSLRLDAMTSHEDRLVVICCTPFHDEGGAAELTAWFEPADDEIWWRLKDMAMEFDTSRMMIVRDGKLCNTSGGFVDG